MILGFEAISNSAQGLLSSLLLITPTWKTMWFGGGTETGYVQSN